MNVIDSEGFSKRRRMLPTYIMAEWMVNRR